MSKKVIGVLLAVVLLMSSLAVIGNAFAGPTDGAEKDLDFTKYETYDSNANYKEIIDNKFFVAYDRNGDFHEGRIAETLKFWLPEISDEYYAATSNEDYFNLYRKMMTPVDGDIAWGDQEEKFDTYYKYRDESQAVIDVSLEVDNETAKPGDTVTLSVYVTSNFYITTLQLGVLYNKDVASAESFKHYIKGWTPQTILDFGYLVDTGLDVRDSYWPSSLQNTESYDKYGIVQLAAWSGPQDLPPDNVPKKFTEKTLFQTVEFKISDDAKNGDTLVLGMQKDFESSLAEEMADTFDGVNRPTIISRSANEYHKNTTDVQAMLEHTINFNSATVTIEAEEKDSANYDDLDKAIEKYDELLAEKDLYTTATWDKYEKAYNAAKAVDRNLTVDEQTTVDNATKALTDAQETLKKIAGPVDPNEKGIISAEVKGDPIVGVENKIAITVKGSPDSIRLSNDDETLTFSRDDAIVTKDSDGNEVWTIKALATKDSTTYTAYVKYENEDYLDDGYEFTVKARSLDLRILSLIIPDMEDDCLERGRHEVIARTTKDVLKLQFVYPDGTTCTFINGQTGYTDATVTTDEATGELVWTFSFNFVNLGDVTYNFRTRATVTSFAGGVHDPLNVTVLY